MAIELTNFEEAFAWLSEVKAAKPTPRLLLGNGFSIAYAPSRFSYTALRNQAEDEGLLGPLALHLFHKLNTQDFEIVIKTLEDAARGLEALDAQKYASEIHKIRAEAGSVKEALAHILAALHPERPNDIDEETYLQVRTFLDMFQAIYTANYDLLLYWTLMQDFTDRGLPPRRHDDGFRDPGYPADHVVWDHLKPHHGNVHYLHGALHLYRGDQGIKKLTWRRTDIALIDQIRDQLSTGAFPLYVAEGTSNEKLERIESSNFLGHALRSLANIGGGLLAYGLSFSKNDKHIIDAITRSSISRMAVSLFGDSASQANQATIQAVRDLQAARAAATTSKPLEIKFFNAGSVRLWS
jgi:uncharacterized protein DUF4917